VDAGWHVAEVSVADRHDLLPGRSAWEIQETADRIGSIAFAVLMVSAIGLLVEPVRPIAIFVCAVSAVPAAIAQYGVRVNHRRTAEEIAASYVTVAHPHYGDVDLVHPKTGVTIRAAGEPAISPAELRHVIKRPS
jgi:hypothetical protein